MIIDVSKEMVIVIIDGVRYVIRLLDNSKSVIAELVSKIIESEFEK